MSKVSAYKEKLLLAVSSPVPASISHLAYVTSPRICSLQASCQDPMNPPGDQLNHFLEPLIDDMVESWERGISFSRMALHLSG